MIEIGRPGSSRTVRKLCRSRRPASRRAGPGRPRGSAAGSAGRSRRRCRSRSREARWRRPGRAAGLPNTSQSRMIHGANTSERDHARRGDDEPRDAPARQATISHVAPSQMASLRVSAASPMTTPSADDARVEQPDALGRWRRSGPSAGTRSRASDRERHRRIGQGAVEEQRQVDRGRQARADGERSGPLRRHPPLLGDVRGEPPGEDRHDRADDDATSTWAAWNGRSEERHRDGGEERRQRQPDLERRSREDERRASGSSRSRPTRGRGPRRGSVRRRRSTPCPRASGTRSARRRTARTTSATAKMPSAVSQASRRVIGGPRATAAARVVASGGTDWVER